MKRKKRKWNMSNPLYRYLHGGKNRKAKSQRTRAKSAGGASMAKKRRGKKSSSMRGFGMSSRGFLPVSGMIAGALIGAGTATLAEKIGVTTAIPYGKYVAGFATAGIPGVLGVFARDMLVSGTAGSTSGGFV